MPDTDVQQQLIDLLRSAEMEQRKAEMEMEDASRRKAYAERMIASIRDTIYYDRIVNNLPHEPIPDTSIQDEYASFGPTEMVERWADAHDGVFEVKHAARAMRDNGMYRTYRQAYNSLRSTVARKRTFARVRSGYYQRTQRPLEVFVAHGAIQTHHTVTNGEEVAMP